MANPIYQANHKGGRVGMEINMLTKNIIEKLKNLGADVVGIGNLEELPEEVRGGLPIGISVGIVYPPKVIEDIEKHPTVEYLEWYERINVKLDEVVTKGGEHIRELGYQVRPLSRKQVSFSFDDFSSLLPHKTVATRAGIGWIGKSALLVTKEYGSAIRISSLLTDAPLSIDSPINESLCRDCTMCTITCPGGAVTGENWMTDRLRGEYYDAKRCYDKARELSSEYLGEEITLCGKCIEVCPYTRRYIKGEFQSE